MASEPKPELAQGQGKWCPSGAVTAISDRYIFDSIHDPVNCPELDYPGIGEGRHYAVDYCCCTGNATGTMCDRIYNSGAAYAVGEHVHFDGSGTESLFADPPCNGGITGHRLKRWNDRNWKITEVRWSGDLGTSSAGGISGLDCGYVYDLYHTTCGDQAGSCSNGYYLGAREDSLSRTGLTSCSTGSVSYCSGLFASGVQFPPTEVMTQYVCWNPGDKDANQLACGNCQSWYVHSFGLYVPPQEQWSGSRSGTTTGECDWLYVLQCYATGTGPGLPGLSGEIYTGIRQIEISTGCC